MSPATIVNSTSTPSELADLEKTITNLLPSQDTITSLVASSNRASASFLRKHVNQVRDIQRNLRSWTNKKEKPYFFFYILLTKRKLSQFNKCYRQLLRFGL
jgi:hypothetical protein